MNIIHPKYKHLAQWLAQLPEHFAESHDTIYNGRNLLKRLRTPDGLSVVVKRYHRPSLLNRLVYSSRLRRPKGLRAYHNALLLRAAGVDSPESIAYIEERCCALLSYSYYVSAECPYTHRFYEWGNAPKGTYERMAEAFAEFAAHMHEAGMLHLDFSPGNILWEELQDGYKFSVVDTNRMYFGTVSVEQGLKNMRRLWGPKDFFRLIVLHYARMRGADERHAMDYALKHRARFWKHYGRRHRIEFDYEP